MGSSAMFFNIPVNRMRVKVWDLVDTGLIEVVQEADIFPGDSGR